MHYYNNNEVVKKKGFFLLIRNQKTKVKYFPQNVTAKQFLMFTLNFTPKLKTKPGEMLHVATPGKIYTEPNTNPLTIPKQLIHKGILRLSQQCG